MNDQPDIVGSPPPRVRLRLRDRWRTPEDERRIGRLMISLGVVGAIVAIFGTVVGWIFVGQLGDASADTLDVTVQTLDAVDDTIDLADDVLASTGDAVDALGGTLTAVSASFETGTRAIDDIASLADTLGPSLTDASDTVRSLSGIGDQIDSALSTLSRLPIGPDYDPATGLGDGFSELADALDTLPPELAATSESLIEFTGNASGLQAQLDEFAASVTDIGGDLGNTEALVDQYRRSVSEARVLAQQTSNDLNNSVVLMRLLLVAGGLTLLFGQVVPLWLGRSLLDDGTIVQPASD